MSLVNCYDACILQDTNNEKHYIVLPDRTAKYLGKNHTTNPEDLDLSDMHFIATADYASETVDLRVIDGNNSYLNDDKMCIGSTYTLFVGDVISFTNYAHEYVMCFTKLKSLHKLR